MKKYISGMTFFICTFGAISSANAGPEELNYCADLLTYGRASSKNPNVNVGNRVWLTVQGILKERQDRYGTMCLYDFQKRNPDCQARTYEQNKAACWQYNGPAHPNSP